MRPLKFINQNITFATNHGKAGAAQGPFERILSTSIAPLAIESDSLGTFTGEIERTGSMLDALRGKIGLARKISDQRLIMASEGSFTSIAGLGLMAHGIEMLLLHDIVTGAEIVEQYIAYDTNYSTATIYDLAGLHQFLEVISFGSHALVIYPIGLPLVGNAVKGITDSKEAEEHFTRLKELSPSKSVMAMSDMRAHLNPTRMRAIESCCELLARRLATMCPKCESGGFGLTATLPGLPCEECGMATQRAHKEVHSCPFCSHRLERPRADGKRYASAGECEWCNP